MFISSLLISFHLHVLFKRHSACSSHFILHHLVSFHFISFLFIHASKQEYPTNAHTNNIIHQHESRHSLFQSFFHSSLHSFTPHPDIQTSYKHTNIQTHTYIYKNINTYLHTSTHTYNTCIHAYMIQMMQTWSNAYHVVYYFSSTIAKPMIHLLVLLNWHPLLEAQVWSLVAWWPFEI